MPHPFTAQGFDGDLRSVHLPPFPGPLWEGGHSSPAPLSEGSHSPPVPLSEAGHTLRRGYPSMTLTVLSCV